MIWLTREEHTEILEHPALVAADKAALLLGDRARERGTAEAVHAHARAQEAAHWISMDLSHEIAQREGRPHAAMPIDNGSHASP